MKSLCNYNSIPAPAAQMAHGNYFVTRPSVPTWDDVFATGDLFILNRKRNAENVRQGCRKRFPLNT
jgi:hypothetical protein